MGTEMDTHTKLIEYDGSIEGVFTYRTQANTISGTVWRFIMDGNKTLVVIPFQSPRNPAEAVHCVLARIESVLSQLSWTVRYVAQANVETVRTWEAEIHEATDADLQKWRAERKWPHLDRWERDRAKAHLKRDSLWIEKGLTFNEDAPPADTIAQWRKEKKDVYLEAEKWRKDRVQARKKITDEIFGPLNDPARMKDVEKERSLLAAKQAEIEARHRKRVKAEKANEAAKIEANAMAELGRTLAAHGVKTLGKAKLKILFNFIREEVCQGNQINPVIRDASLRRILAKVEEMTGVDMSEHVFLAHLPNMKEHFEELAKETARTEQIGEEDARRSIMERVRFVAAFEDGICHLIQSITMSVHDEEDARLFRDVAPCEAERESIQRFHEMQAEMRQTARFQGIVARLTGHMDADTARRNVSITELTRKAPCWISEDGKTTFALGDGHIVKSKQLAEVLNVNYLSAPHTKIKDMKTNAGLRFWLSTDLHHKGDPGYFMTSDELASFKERKTKQN